MHFMIFSDLALQTSKPPILISRLRQNGLPRRNMKIVALQNNVHYVSA
jgi:hypothetical protein